MEKKPAYVMVEDASLSKGMCRIPEKSILTTHLQAAALLFEGYRQVYGSDLRALEACYLVLGLLLDPVNDFRSLVEKRATTCDNSQQMAMACQDGGLGRHSTDASTNH